MNSDKDLAAHSSVISDEPALTPAASEKLEQNMETLRLQILREVARKSKGSGARARASDVDSAVSRILLFGSSAARIRFFWPASVLVITVINVLAQLHAVKIGDTQLIYVGLPVIAGIATSVALILVVQDARRGNRSGTSSATELLHAFEKLENSMRKSSQELLGPIADDTSLGRVISAVELLQLWTPEDSSSFRRVLGTRNSIAHEEHLQVSPEEMAYAYSQIARLSDLLDKNVSGRLRGIATNLWYEERVSNSLRRAGLSVSRAQGDPGYDFLAGKSDILKAVVCKYRSSGLLTVNDVTDTVDKLGSAIGIVVVTNAEISPYVHEYIMLTREQAGREKWMSIVPWRDISDTRALVDVIVSD
jgi:hypothetical protein